MRRTEMISLSSPPKSNRAMTCRSPRRRSPPTFYLVMDLAFTDRPFAPRGIRRIAGRKTVRAVAISANLKKMDFHASGHTGGRIASWVRHYPRMWKGRDRDGFVWANAGRTRSIGFVLELRSRSGWVGSYGWLASSWTSVDNHLVRLNRLGSSWRNDRGAR